VALFQTARDYDFLQSFTFAIGGGAGFTLALTLLASVRERVQLAEVPDVAQGTVLVLMLAGVLSLSFMGFAGLGG
jgi:electron transport complex protein RnfA